MPSEQKRNISLCTWNVCLGARCKLSIIKDLLYDNKIDVLCVQESEIKSEENLDDYQITNYSLEAEIVSAGFKIRTVMYIKSDISYQRINQLEKADSHQIVIKLLKANVVVTSLYRTYQLTVHQGNRFYERFRQSTNICKLLPRESSQNHFTDKNRPSNIQR